VVGPHEKENQKVNLKKIKPESFFAHAYLETGIHIKHKFRKRCWGIGQKPYTLETSDLPNS
jgi:hypothetical protein